MLVLVCVGSCRTINIIIKTPAHLPTPKPTTCHFFCPSSDSHRSTPLQPYYTNDNAPRLDCTAPHLHTTAVRALRPHTLTDANTKRTVESVDVREQSHTFRSPSSATAFHIVQHRHKEREQRFIPLFLLPWSGLEWEPPDDKDDDDRRVEPPPFSASWRERRSQVMETSRASSRIR